MERSLERNGPTAARHQVRVESRNLPSNGQWVRPGEPVLRRRAGNMRDPFLPERQLCARNVIILADHHSRLPAALPHELARMDCRETRVISRAIHKDGARRDATPDQDSPHHFRFLKSFRAAAAADQDCLDGAFPVQFPGSLQTTLKTG
jgi:hypothetical protein